MRIYKRSRTAALAAGLGMLLLAGGVEAAPVCVTTGPLAGHCYDTSTGQGLDDATWTDAAAMAATVSFNGQPGHLATITSLDESLFISGNVTIVYSGASGPWIGLFQSAGGVEPGTPAQGAAGGWQWVTGEAFYAGDTVIFENWAGGEPNQFLGTEEDFGQFFIGADAQGHQWNDLVATNTLPYLIEFEPASNGVRVPEPATLLLLGSAIAGLATVARRRRHQS